MPPPLRPEQDVRSFGPWDSLSKHPVAETGRRVSQVDQVDAIGNGALFERFSNFSQGLQRQRFERENGDVDIRTCACTAYCTRAEEKDFGPVRAKTRKHNPSDLGEGTLNDGRC